MINSELKKGVLYKNVVKNRFKFLAIVLFISVMFAQFTITIMPVLSKLAAGPSALDERQFAAKTDFAERQNQDDEENVFSAANDKIYGFAIKELTYWQGDKYCFKVPAENLERSGISFTMNGKIVTADTDIDADPIAVTVWYCDIGGRKTAVLASGKDDLESQKTIEGILVKMPTVVSDALFDSGLGNGEISAYMLDVRGIRLDSELSDSIIWLLFAVILIYLIVRLASYYVNPLRHPTYKQLEKYGDVTEVAADVENQLANGVTAREKGRVYTHDWIVSDSTFKKIIEKNFTAGGSFRYTPGQH